MATIYADYSKDRVGWFFGLSGWQLATLATCSLPTFWAINQQAWLSALLLTGLWALLLIVVVVPVRGRSATGWLLAAASYALGGMFGWSRFRSRAASGRSEDLNRADLPGVLQPVQVHDGPPHGATLRRVALIQDHGARTWAVTAAVVHPGIGMSGPAERHQLGAALTRMLDAACATELVDEVLFLVRTVPEDGAEREQWLSEHRRPGGPDLARRVNEDLLRALNRASVRTETFVTVVVPEARIAKVAKDSGGGLGGRARVLHSVMNEVEAHLRGPMLINTVTWLTSPELSAACRTGFAPGDRAGIVDAVAAATRDSGVNADVPWAMAGPSGADPVVRHYSHDAWNSISSTIKLPANGAALGALAPVLTPAEPGERRALVVVYPIVATGSANRQSANSEWASDLSTGLRARLGVRQRAAQREEASKAGAMDGKLARGNCMVRPYAVCTVTVPKTVHVADAGRRLDASVRRAGFAPLRLDLAQDRGFAASTVPLGIGLTRKGDA